MSTKSTMLPPKHGEIREAQSVEETLDRMHARLGKVVPEEELILKAELVYQINQLKKERNAVILGHNYMEPALYHSVPDYVGDSLQLSRISAETDADISFPSRRRDAPSPRESRRRMCAA